MPRKARPPRTRPADAANGPEGQRLQKVLASAGVASRRECETLIEEGRVEVDRQVVTELGTRVDPGRCEIRVDGVPLNLRRRVYFAVNKPPGVVCTNRDPEGRTRVVDLVGSNERLFTIGRLDRSSEGLIVVTNDGELANRLTHPRYGIEKVYRVRVAGHPEPALLRKLEHGVRLAEGWARVVSARVRRKTREATELEIVLNEGRNREIRRLLARLGHKVLELKRIAMGSLRLGEMPAGAYRKLTAQEVKRLQASAAGGAKLRRRKKSAREAKPDTQSSTSEGRGRRSAPADRLGTSRPATVLGYEPDRSSRSAESGSRPGGRKRKVAKRTARKRK